MGDFKLRRLGIVMESEPGNLNEVESPPSRGRGLKQGIKETSQEAPGRPLRGGVD